MNTLIITPHNETEMQLISDFLKKLNLTPRILSEEEQEDFEDILAVDNLKYQNADDVIEEVEDDELLHLMSEADRTDKVDLNLFMNKLRKNASRSTI
jgi:hypothetical protein